MMKIIGLVTQSEFNSFVDTTNTSLDAKASTITLNNFMVNTNTSLNLKAPLNNASFTGNIGINLLNTDTLDSALLVKGQRNDNPTKEGIRMGYSFNVVPGSRSYGIEICSAYEGRSTIDFTYPDLNSYYAGRITLDN